MARSPRKSQEQDRYGMYMFRDGEQINLEKVPDRFTAISPNLHQVQRWAKVPGIKGVRRVTRNVFKVATTASARDEAMDVIRRGDFHTIAHHAYSPEGRIGTTYYLTDDIVVRFKKAATGKVQEFCQKYGLVALKRYPLPEPTYLLKVTSKKGMNPLKVANRLVDEDAYVEWAEPNLINRFRQMSAPAFAAPRDEFFRKQWHLTSEPDPDMGLEAAASIHALEAWQELTGLGSRDVVIAVLDDGFDLANSDFKPSDKIVHPMDFRDHDEDPIPSAIDNDIHGTPCAALAIAESNAAGVVGVAPGCSFMPVRIPIKLSDNRLATIFETVGKHANVISFSIGSPPARTELSTLLRETLTNVATRGGPKENGCVICVAAGNWDAPINDDENANGFTYFDMENQVDVRVEGPIKNRFAAHPDVIAVAACTSQKKHSAYSNWGPEVWVCAPSNNFDPMHPSVTLTGLGIVTADNERVGGELAAGSRVTEKFGGTSAAAPQVAGVAALILSANQNLTAGDVKKILAETADEIVDDGRDILDGVCRGKPTTDGNGGRRSDWFGYGKVNAKRAVDRAKQMP